MFGNLLLLWLAALALMGSPGPATLSLAAMGAAFGARRALAYLGGIIAGTTGVLIAIAAGVTQLILSSPTLVSVITVVAVAYILYLAFRIATAPVGGEVTVGAKAPSFSGGLLLAISNPKAFAAIGAVYSTHVVVEGDLALDTVVKILALAAVIATVNPAWLWFGAALSAILRHPVAGRVANVIFAVLLVVSVIPALSSL